ncbi:MAG TPA: hypothetical protein VFV93_14210 [Thermomicrobiales bacterium]|nr:hypothetical protein [Thermomicrobiales bacterium]
MAVAGDRRGSLIWFALLVALVLVACGEDEDAPAAAATDAATASPPTATAGGSLTVSPVSATPNAIPTGPAPATTTITESVDDAATPLVVWADTAQLDNPTLGVDVYWLGEQFDPAGDLPLLVLTWVTGSPQPGGGPPGMRAILEYPTASDEPGGVNLMLVDRAEWEAVLARDPATDDYARLARMFWDSPCATQETVELDGGQATIYASYQALAGPSTGDCPAGQFDRYLAHAVFGETVVLVNAPLSLQQPPDVPDQPYDSLEGMRQVVLGLRLREPVLDPTPVPTPAASLDDPGSLVLQPADLPGRYGYGDDGCSPRYECNRGPTGFGSEGGYGRLVEAAGQFLGFYYQYEHVGFNSSGPPDPNIEPPVIDSFALVCLQSCDPAAILEAGQELLRYNGSSDSVSLDGPPALGDETRLYRVDTLVFGQITRGYAVIWRHGSVVGMVIVGGADEVAGRQLAIDLATKQAERIAFAVGR